MATVLHLVRHGTYELIGHAMGGRLPGYGLTADGRAEADAVAKTLGRRPIRAVISSPIQRARETADAIAAPHGLTVVTEADLNEVDTGDWTGRTFDDLALDPRWGIWNRFRCAASAPGGESMLQVQSRAIGSVVRLSSAFPDCEVVVVSHADVLKAIIMGVLGIPLDLLHRFAVDPGSRSLLVFHSDGAELRGLNIPAGG